LTRGKRRDCGGADGGFGGVGVVLGGDHGRGEPHGVGDRRIDGGRHQAARRRHRRQLARRLPDDGAEQRVGIAHARLRLGQQRPAVLQAGAGLALLAGIAATRRHPTAHARRQALQGVEITAGGRQHGLRALHLEVGLHGPQRDRVGRIGDSPTR
jgi:hypothetical protein